MTFCRITNDDEDTTWKILQSCCFECNKILTPNGFWYCDMTQMFLLFRTKAQEVSVDDPKINWFSQASVTLSSSYQDAENWAISWGCPWHPYEGFQQNNKKLQIHCCINPQCAHCRCRLPKSLRDERRTLCTFTHMIH